MSHRSNCNCSKCRRNAQIATRVAIRTIRREAAEMADVPVMMIGDVVKLAAQLWPVRGVILYHLAHLARGLMVRHRLPVILALKVAARRLNVPARVSSGHFTRARIKAQRRKMDRVRRHKDPRLRHTFKGKRFEEMAY